MGGGAPRSSSLGGEFYSSPGRRRFLDVLARFRLRKAYRSRTTLTLPQNSTSEFTVLVVAPARRHRTLAAWSQLAPP